MNCAFLLENCVAPYMGIVHFRQEDPPYPTKLRQYLGEGARLREHDEIAPSFASFLCKRESSGQRRKRLADSLLTSRNASFSHRWPFSHQTFPILSTFFVERRVWYGWILYLLRRDRGQR
jgi:hypothetical protein